MANRSNKGKPKCACDSYSFPVNFEIFSSILLHNMKGNHVCADKKAGGGKTTTRVLVSPQKK